MLTVKILGQGTRSGDEFVAKSKGMNLSNPQRPKRPKASENVLFRSSVTVRNRPRVLWTRTIDTSDTDVRSKVSFCR